MQSTFKFFRDGVEERVQAERWGWGVMYKDDTELHQFGDDGMFHQFGEINQDNVSLFVMYRLDDIGKRYDIVVTPGMKLIHFYRNVRPYWSDVFIKTYGFGYEKNIGGKNEIVLIFILPDDRVVITDNKAVDLTLFNLGK